MIDTDALTEQSNEIAQLLEERLGVRGTGLEAKLNKAGRLLPKWVRREAEKLIEAENIASHPKLMMKADPARYSRAHKRVRKWLKSIDPKKRRVDRALGWIGSISLSLIVFAGLLIAVLVMVGFI